MAGGSYSDSESLVLPEIIIREILTQLLHHHKSLLNSRLVCTQWNQVIENISEIMKKLTFTITDLQEFLNLPIAMKERLNQLDSKQLNWEEVHLVNHNCHKD